MKAIAKSKKQKKGKAAGSKASQPVYSPTHNATTQNKPVSPDYSGMYAKFREIGDPVSFEELKEFCIY